MDRLQKSFMSIEQMTGAYLNQTKNNTDSKNVSGDTDFKQVLKKVKEEKENVPQITFSKHANERLESRNINLSEEQMSRLNKGIMQAKEKSINESLVMMDDIAFIVNIKNNTVITAIDMDAKTVSDALSDKTKLEGQTQERNVFTNIDGAVIV